MANQLYDMATLLTASDKLVSPWVTLLKAYLVALAFPVTLGVDVNAGENGTL